MKRKKSVTASDPRVTVRITIEVMTHGKARPLSVPLTRADVDELTHRLTSGAMTVLGSVPHLRTYASAMKVT